MKQVVGFVLLLLPLVVLAESEKAEPEPTKPKLWALLVAGSSGYYNYRHQADVCHAFQIVKSHGIPEENIVVMMYDDIANNEENPTPGIIINHPNGKDVYHGVPKDYTKEEVTPENFLKVLKGDKQGMNGIGSGKVINSGPNDHIFVNFVDHGAPGLVAFPDGELTVKQLQSALLEMYENKQYAQMVLYVEACESGSMFRNVLPNNIDVYATTAANGNESSYACYYDKKRGTYLGDWYSVHWMENSDRSNLHKESLIEQFKITKNETNTSHVEEFGDLRIGREPVADFQGGKSVEPFVLPKVPYSAAPSHEVPLDILFRKRSYSNDRAERDRISRQITEMLQKRALVEHVVKALADKVGHGPQDNFLLFKKKPKDYLTKLDCHDIVVHDFSKKCFNLGKNPYALKYVYVLANMCENGFTEQEILQAIQQTCVNIPLVEGGIH